MIDLVIVIGRDGGSVAATSERGKAYVLDTEFTDDLYQTWCDKSIAAGFGVHGTKAGLDIIFAEDSPAEIRSAIQLVKDNATETPIYEYIEALVYKKGY